MPETPQYPNSSSAGQQVSCSGCDFQVMGPSRDGVTIDGVIRMANGLQNKPPSGMRVIAVLRHYRRVVLDQQPYLVLMGTVLQSPLQLTTQERRYSADKIS